MKLPGRTTDARRRRRAGVSWLGCLLTLAFLGATVGGGLYYWRLAHGGNAALDSVILQPVTQGLFRHIVTERGEVESSSNVEVQCLVQSKNTAGTAILEIVPEGTYVEKGDFLVRLDASALEDEKSRQQITCNSSEALVIQAENTVKTAEIARREYLDGTFKQEEQLILGEISVAEENLRRAEDYVRYSEILSVKGLVTPLQLDADKFAVEKSRMDLEAAKTKITVLRDFTKLKMLSQLEADIKTAQANLKSQQSIHALDLDKLKHIEEQIAQCELRAPAAGQVVYANKSSGRGGTSDVVIEAGALVRERQVIVRLPDPKRMQVKAKINESRIDRVRSGMPAMVRLDAFPDRELVGKVTKVDDYPLPGSWFMTNVKEYATLIEISEPPPGMRPGMTAEVAIRVQEIADAVQVPVQAIVEQGGAHYCLLMTGGGQSLEPRPVEIGASNEKFVQIKSGVNTNEQVVVNPRGFLSLVDLPKAPESKPDKESLLAKADVPAEKTAGPRDDTATAAKSGDSAVVPASATAPASGGGGGNEGDGERRRRREGAAGSGMNPAQMAGMMIERMDKNGDSLLSQDEVPEQMRGTFSQTDTSGDGQIDRAELTAAMAKYAARMAGGGGPTGGAGGGPNAAAPQ